MSVNVTKQELFEMIIELRQRVDELTGKPRSPITMREARLANERGDKVTMQLYLDQFKKNPSLLDRFTKQAEQSQSQERRKAC